MKRIAASLALVVLLASSALGIQRLLPPITGGGPADRFVYAEAEGIPLSTICRDTTRCWHDVWGLSELPACATGDIVGTISASVTGGKFWARLEVEGPLDQEPVGDSFLAPPQVKFVSGTNTMTFVGTLRSAVVEGTDQRMFTIEQHPISGTPVIDGVLSVTYQEGTC